MTILTLGGIFPSNRIARSNKTTKPLLGLLFYTSDKYQKRHIGSVGFPYFSAVSSAAVGKLLECRRLGFNQRRIIILSLSINYHESE